MQAIRKFFVLPVLSAGQLAELILTFLGIVGFMVGLIVMPSIGLTIAEFYAGLLGLVGFMVLCFSAGQLAVIREGLLSREADRRAVDHPAKRGT